MARVTSTVSGPIVSFNSPGKVSINHLKVNFLPTQEGTGDPSPDNIRPISGRTWLTGYRTGKNLFDASAVVRRDGYRKDDSGAELTTSQSGYTQNYIPVKPNTKYTFSGTIVKGSESFRLYYYDKSKAWIERTSTINISGLPLTFTTPVNCEYIQLQYQILTVDFSTIQIELGETASPYEEYAGISLPITFPAAGNNLLKLAGRELVAVNPTTFSNATKRTFTEGTYVKGLTSNNYCQTSQDVTGISISDSAVTFTISARAYGLCFPVFNLVTGEQYTISASSAGTGVLQASFYQKDGTFISYQSYTSAHYDYTTFTVPVGTYCTVICFGGQADNSEVSFTNIMLSKESAVTSYEPYTNTLYGGYVDLVTGEVWKTYGLVDLGSLTWKRIKNPYGSLSETYIFYASLGAKERYVGTIENYKWSTMYSYLSIDKTAGWIYYRDICIRDDSYTDENNFKESLNGTHLVYPLYTPVLIGTISPLTITTLKDCNNIWSDAENVEVNYDFAESINILSERKKMIAANTPHQVTISGSLVTFETDIVAPIEIIGQGNITITGKNMLNPATLIDPNPFTSEGITFSIDNDGIVTVNGIAGDTNSPQYRFVWDLSFSADCYFCANAPYSGTYTETYAYNVTLGQRFTKWDGVTNGQSSSSTRVLSEAHLIEGYRCGIHIRISRGSGKEFVNDKFYPMLLPGSCTDSTFEPYKGITLPVGSLFKSFKGINNIWSDNGDITVRYWTH